MAHSKSSDGYWDVSNRKGVKKKFKKISGDWENYAAVKEWLYDNSDPKAEKEATRKITKQK